jgi:hypothetical protein
MHPTAVLAVASTRVIFMARFSSLLGSYLEWSGARLSYVFNTWLRTIILIVWRSARGASYYNRTF